MNLILLGAFFKELVNFLLIYFTSCSLPTSWLSLPQSFPYTPSPSPLRGLVASRYPAIPALQVSARLGAFYPTEARQDSPA